MRKLDQTAIMLDQLARERRLTIKLVITFVTLKINLMERIPFTVINWETISPTEHPGAPGTALWQTWQHPGLRIRMVTYSPGYLADHWCRKGHIVHCLEGSFESELEDGSRSMLAPGMTYVVSDDASSHRSYTKEGVKLLIIDGDFLK